MNKALRLVEQGKMPDAVVRWGIRRLLAERLRLEDKGSMEANAQARQKYIQNLKESPVAIAVDKANEQHYEVPAAFFLKTLGPRLKYSCCWWEPETDSLKKAEEDMLALTCERAQLLEGMNILELGCGWGSLTLWMAEQYPGARVTAVSNSRTQREFILARCKERGLANVEVITADMNDFRTPGTYDRVVSVEMFEHMRNYEELMARVASWLKPGGKLFVHIFTHRFLAYLFEVRDASDWMSRFFFTGGQMPSDDLLLFFQRDLLMEDHWCVNGVHYTKTLLAWLEKMDAAKEEIMGIMRQVYGEKDAHLWFVRWRIFMLACAELFGYRGGEEWLVSHYRFVKR
jgi:cyclopropane-fatty-acyl-phospholipid synthase